MYKLLSNNLIITEDKSIKKNLQRYSLLLSLTEEACKAWMQNQWERFDPIVGENACQIRAIKMALLVQSDELGMALLFNRVRIVRKGIDGFIQSNELSHQPFFNLIQERNLELEMTKDQRFLIDSFLLTIASSLKPSDSEEPLLRKDVAAPQKLFRFGSCSTLFLKNLVAETRRRLSLHSIEFVNEMARRMGDEEGEKMSRLPFVVVTDLFARARWCMPCFWSFKNMVDLIRVHRIPVVVRCRLIATDRQNQEMGMIALFLEPDEMDRYRPALPTADLKPAIYVEGCMARVAHELLDIDEWKNELLNHNIFDLILAFAASHRQYPEESKDVLVNSMNHPSYESWGLRRNGTENRVKLLFLQ